MLSEIKPPFARGSAVDWRMVNIMAMSEPVRDEIVPLWPTWIGQLQFPGAEGPNRALAELAAPAAPPSVVGNLFDADHTAVTWLREGIVAAVGQWFEKMQVQPAPQ